MQRLCGRPGCSDAASVAYGMRAEDLVFWLDVLPEGSDDDVAVLCRRHADSMVVPRGWTLDDLRDPDLHLFRPPVPLPPPTPRARVPRPARDPDATGEQLRLHTDFELLDDDHDGADSTDGADSIDDADSTDDADSADDAGLAGDTDDTDDHDLVDAIAETETAAGPGPWTPAFDEADDLEGLLSARGPLLSRAFRTAGRSND